MTYRGFKRVQMVQGWLNRVQVVAEDLIFRFKKNKNLQTLDVGPKRFDESQSQTICK